MKEEVQIRRYFFYAEKDAHHTCGFSVDKIFLFTADGFKKLNNNFLLL